MKVDTFACDICGVQKKDTNNWFIGSETKEVSPHICRDGMQAMVLGVVVIPWHEAFLDNERAVHLCGVSCATKFVARELAK